MGENELNEILGSFKDAIDLLLGKVESLEERLEGCNADVKKLSETLYDEVLAPAQSYLENEAKEERFGDFKEKYGAKYEPFNKSLGAITGDADYDATRRAFDEFDSMPEPKDADAYVEESVKGLADQIAEVKEAFGLAQDSEVTLKPEADGTQTVESDGEEVAKIDENGNVEEVADKAAESDEKKDEAPGKQEELNFDEDEESDEEKSDESPEDVEKYEKELLEALK